MPVKILTTATTYIRPCPSHEDKQGKQTTALFILNFETRRIRKWPVSHPCLFSPGEGALGTHCTPARLDPEMCLDR